MLTKLVRLGKGVVDDVDVPEEAIVTRGLSVQRIGEGEEQELRFVIPRCRALTKRLFARNSRPKLEKEHKPADFVTGWQCVGYSRTINAIT